MFLKNSKSKGFTLIELLVVVSIIGLLSSIVFASLNSTRAKGRDAKRLGDLIQIRNALELYYGDNNKYPTTSGSWWGNCSGFGSFSTTGAGGYIPNLAPTYIPVLPLDPKPINANTCYVYQSDANGKDYMFLVYQTVEGTVPASLKRPSYVEQDYAIYTPGAATW